MKRELINVEFLPKTKELQKAGFEISDLGIKSLMGGAGKKYKAHVVEIKKNDRMRWVSCPLSGAYKDLEEYIISLRLKYAASDINWEIDNKEEIAHPEKKWPQKGLKPITRALCYLHRATD